MNDTEVDFRQELDAALAEESKVGKAAFDASPADYEELKEDSVIQSQYSHSHPVSGTQSRRKSFMETAQEQYMAN